MVNPVTEAGATERRVYLPKDSTWYDFWTGEKIQGGRYIQAQAPLERLPLYVRAGSILPLGPDEEYADEKPDGPIELRIYPGANGTFTLYNDEGNNYNYEKGEFSTIPVTWSEADHTVTIGPRTGHYPGMPKTISVRLFLANAGKGFAASSEVEGKSVQYDGSELKMKLDQ